MIEALLLEERFAKKLAACLKTDLFIDVGTYYGWGECAPSKHGGMETVFRADEGVTAYVQSFTPEDDQPSASVSVIVQLDTVIATGCVIHQCRERELAKILCKKFAEIEKALDDVRWSFTRAETATGFSTIFSATVKLSDDCHRC